jgi:predicted transcriptional regulator of viral defense system
MSRIGPTLFDLAGEHDGIFTAAEASNAGISSQALVMAERRGTIGRLARGIYRLQSYPSDETRVQLWEALLWPTTQRRSDVGRCVLSHLTALHLHEPNLSYQPSRVSICVPPSLRLRRSSMPSWLDVHRDELSDDDVTSVEGLPTTTLMRSLRDCIAIGTDRRLIEQAIASGSRNRLIRGIDVRKLRAEIS